MSSNAGPRSTNLMKKGLEKKSIILFANKMENYRTLPFVQD